MAQSKKVEKTPDNIARRAVLEDLFYDFHKKRGQVFWMNFLRGIFFGLGSVLGGTIVVGLIIWILSLLVDVPGGVGNFVQSVMDTLQSNAN